MSAVDFRGNFLAISDVSRAAADSGLTSEQVVGSKLWDFNDPDTSETIRRTFAKCLIENERQRITLKSTINGQEEYWANDYLPCHGAEILVHSREVLAPEVIDVTDDDRRMLHLLSDDFTVKEIAAEFGVSTSSIGSRLQRLRDKCSVKTNHGLVAYCLKYGLL